MTKGAITTATPCAALRASLPGRGRRQISVFSGKTSGGRARRRVFRDVFVEDVIQEEKKFIRFIFLPAASSTRRLRAAADWGSWRTSSLKTHGGSCRRSCLGSTRDSARRLARAAAWAPSMPQHKAQRGGAPAPPSSVERTPPPPRRLAHHLCMRGVRGPAAAARVISAAGRLCGPGGGPTCVARAWQAPRRPAAWVALSAPFAFTITCVAERGFDPRTFGL